MNYTAHRDARELAPMSIEEAWQTSYKETMNCSPAEQAAWLLDTIGVRFTAAGVGVTDARTVRRWSSGGSEPRDYAEAHRLAVLFRIAFAITLVYGRSSVAASFLRSANPQLDDRAPLVVLASSDPLDVEPQLLAAARAFLEG